MALTCKEDHFSSTTQRGFHFSCVFNRFHVVLFQGLQGVWPGVWSIEEAYELKGTSRPHGARNSVTDSVGPDGREIPNL